MSNVMSGANMSDVIMSDDISYAKMNHVVMI